MQCPAGYAAADRKAGYYADTEAGDANAHARPRQLADANTAAVFYYTHAHAAGWRPRWRR